MGVSDFTNNKTNAAPPPSVTPPPPPSGSTNAANMMTNMNIPDVLIDYNEKFKNAAEILYRNDLIEQTISVIIGKNKPNALLVGSAGVGKTKIAEDIARRISNDDPSVPSTLKGFTLYELPITALVAGAGIVGELESRVQNIIEFAVDPDNKAILFIDEIHLLTDDRSQTYSKIAQILKPALARGDMRVIGATTLQESRSFMDDPAFSRRFSRLIVDELTPAQTLDILHNARSDYMTHYQNKVAVSDDILATIQTIADEYSRAEMHRPDNALTLMDRAMAEAMVTHNAAIAKAQQTGDTLTYNTLSAMPHITLGNNKVKNTAIKLMTGHARKDDFDKTEVIQQLKVIKGQDKVIDELITALSAHDANLFPSNKPLTWMFAGASGVGKTEISKIISRGVTDQEPIIINMAEFHSAASINRIIGSPAGYVGSDSNRELPFDSLESNPYRVILLDEFEKSDAAVQRLFLSAIDEGYMRTAAGNNIDFSKAIIIATTNAAREHLSKAPLGFGNASTPDNKSLIKNLENFFDTELLARFTKIFAFNKLNKETYKSICLSIYTEIYNDLTQRLPHIAAKLPYVPDQSAITNLVESTYIESQGARPARKAIETYVEKLVSMP